MKVNAISGAMAATSEITMPRTKEEAVGTIDFQYTRQEPQDEGTGKLKRPDPPVKPQKPVKPEIENNLLVYTVKDGDNLSVLAERYHVKESQIKELNNLKSKDFIKTGQKLKIPYVDDKKWAAYMEAKKKYEGYYDSKREARIIGEKEKYDKALEVYNKTLKSIEKVEYIECATNVFDKGITLSVDNETGNIVIKADRKGLNLGDIRRALFIKKGVLLSQNPDFRKTHKDKLKFGLGFKLGEGIRREGKWDKMPLEQGETLEIDPKYVHYTPWEKITSEY